MGYADRTTAFKAQVKELSKSYPPPAKKRRGKERQAGDLDATNDGFLTEAYAIVSYLLYLGQAPRLLKSHRTI